MALQHLLAALTIGAAASSVRADDPIELPDSLPPEVRQMLEDAMARQKSHPPVTFSVDFAGGTVTQYLDAIRAACPKANIVGAAGLDQYKVPPITLKDVTVHGALQPLDYVVSLEGARASRVKVWFNDDVASVWLEDEFRRDGATIDDENAPEPETLVWNSRELTSKQAITVDDITGAIDTALSVFPQDKPIVRIHEQTGILVVRGTEDQLAAVREVIQELSKSQKVTSDAERTIQRYQEAVDSLQMDTRKLELYIGNLEARRAAMEAGSEADAIDSELFNRRRELDEYRAKLQATTEAMVEAQARAQPSDS